MKLLLSINKPIMRVLAKRPNRNNNIRSTKKRVNKNKIILIQPNSHKIMKLQVLLIQLQLNIRLNQPKITFHTRRKLSQNVKNQ